MPEIPPLLPESGKYKALYRWLNKLRLAVVALRPAQSLNVMTEQTAVGVYRQGTARGKTGEAASLQFRGQWVDQAYDEGDIVICRTTAEEDDGYKPGTFIANSSVSAGDLHPGTTVQTATAEATIAAGVITDITVTDPGDGYAVAPGVTITGDGSDAEAHAVLTGTQVSSIVIDDGGTGYSEATITIGDPTQTQKWAPFADRPKEKTTWRPVHQDRKRQVIILNAGRDTNELPIIVAYKDKDDPAKGYLKADLGAALALLPEGVACDIEFHEWEVCIDNVSQYALFWSSSPYDK